MQHLINWIPMAIGVLNLTGAVLTLAATIRRTTSDRNGTQDQSGHRHPNPGQGTTK